MHINILLPLRRVIELSAQDEDYDLAKLVLTSKHRRAKRGILAKFLNKTLPPDPKPTFVSGFLAEIVLKAHSVSRWSLALLVPPLLVMTILLTMLLLKVPFLEYSVVQVLTNLFNLFVSDGWATGLAWAFGITVVVVIGSFVDHDLLQRQLDYLPATKNHFYNFWLRLALWEEMVFRAGSEKWTWAERVRASFLFGIIHIVNIWYSMAAGLSIGLTGFAFMLIYQWHYRKTQNQIYATSVTGVVHALYNVAAVALIAVVGIVWLVQKFIL
jgi:hypothetical protein